MIPQIFKILENALKSQLKIFNKKFHDGLYLCDDPTCKISANIMSINQDLSCPINLCSGKMVCLYSANDFHKQLCYFKHIFEREVLAFEKRFGLGKNGQKISQTSLQNMSDQNKIVYRNFKNLLENVVQPRIDHNGFDSVSGRKLFSMWR